MAPRKNKIISVLEETADQPTKIKNIDENVVEIKEKDQQTIISELQKKLDTATSMYTSLLEEKESLDSVNDKLQAEIDLLTEKINQVKEQKQSDIDLNISILNNTIREKDIRISYLEIENEKLKEKLLSLTKNPNVVKKNPRQRPRNWAEQDNWN